MKRTFVLPFFLMLLGIVGLPIAAAQTFAAPAQHTSVPRTITVTLSNDIVRTAYAGHIEAVRRATISSQVPGAIIGLDVSAGDQVEQEQILLQIDSRIASESARAGSAQTDAARAALAAARQEFERQRILHEKGYTSRAAFEQAQANYQAAAADARARQATADAAGSHQDLHIIRAPFDGRVAQVSVELGDMVMPGMKLLGLFAPDRLRVQAHVPQSALPAGAARLPAEQIRIELPDGEQIVPLQTHILPAVDVASGSVELRLALPGHIHGRPGTPVRVWLPARHPRPIMWIPAQALVRRGEVTGVYVLDTQQQSVLRLVRTGLEQDGQLEILAGLRPGERVLVQPPASAAMSIDAQ